jgi:signal transduction histidine kinase
MTTMTLLVESDDDDTRIISIARDITSLKQSEQELRSAKDETEEANLALHESLSVLKETQEQLIQSEKLASLGSLVAGVSHEINTPLGVGVTASSFLEERTQAMTASRKAGTFSNDSVDKYLNIAAEASSIILNNLNRAANLVRSFKQVADDQSGETRRRFNFKEYLDELLISLRPKYRRTTHQVTVDCPEHIELDSYPGVFSQIVTNLLINSLRHGLEGIEGGKIHIAIEVHNDILRMVHSDNGRGMDEETRNQVFDPFFTTRRGAGGSGLGLNIVYNLVTRTLGGRIVCQSTPGKGSAFILSLPINRGAVDSERALQSGSQPSDPPSSK